MGFRPLGEGRGGAFRRAGEGLPQAAVFVPAPAGLFLPPTAAFFTVVIAGVMRGMTVVMAVTAQRKTCFPTVSTTGTTKAKPPAVPTAFCVYFSPSPTLPKGRAPHQTALNTARMDSRPLGRAGEGLCRFRGSPTSSQRTSGRRGADSLCCCANTAHCGHRDAG